MLRYRKIEIGYAPFVVEWNYKSHWDFICTIKEICHFRIVKPHAFQRLLFDNIHFFPYPEHLLQKNWVNIPIHFMSKYCILMQFNQIKSHILVFKSSISLTFLIKFGNWQILGERFCVMLFLIFRSNRSVHDLHYHLGKF